MVILNIIPSLSGGGAEKQLSYLAPLLADKGHKVYIVYCQSKSKDPISQYKNVTLIKVEISSNYSPIFLFKLLKIIAKVKPDIVQTWITQTDIFGGLACKIKNIPWVIREPSDKGARPVTWKLKLRNRIAKSANAIVSNSVKGEAYWKNLYPEKNISIIRNGFNIPAIINSSISKREELGIQPFEKVVLYVGRIEKDKNVHRLIQAINQIETEHEIKVLIAGDGNYKNELLNLIKELNLTSKVHLLGHLDHDKIIGLMKMSDLFCFLSAHEGMPNAVIEAMLCKTPLLLSDIEAHRDIVSESSANIVDPNNTSDIANNLSAILSNKENQVSKVQKAYAIAAGFDLDQLSSRYETLYKQLIK